MSNFDKIRLIQAGERLDGVHPTDDDVLNRPVIDIVNNLEAGQLNIYATKQSIPFVDNSVFAVSVVDEDIVGYDLATQKFVKATTTIRPVGIADLVNHVVHVSGVKTVSQILETGKKYFLSNTLAGEIVPENDASKSFIEVGRAIDVSTLYYNFGYSDSFIQSAIWGNISGSITNQTDLKNALNGKSNIGHLHTGVYEPYNPAIQSHLTQTYGNPHMVTKAEVGLGNADNTSDLDKPISTATQTALNLKEDKANKGVANGYASLDATGKVPSTQLPSYVDDVLEYTNLASFPGTGEIGKLYVARDTNKVYRWSGSVYVYITSGAVDSVDGRTGLVTLSDLYAPLSHVGSTGSAHGLVTTSVNGFMSATDKTKLNGIEAGATADMTASEILTAIKTVDGSGSGLDADLLDGQDGSFYSNQNAFSNIAVSGQTTVSADTQTDTLTLVAGTNVTITTDAVNDTITISANDTSVDWTEIQNKPDPTITLTGDVTGTGTMTDLGSVSFVTTIAANSVALGTDTTGNYVAGLTAGTGITISGTAGEGWSPTVTNSAPNVTTDISVTHNAGTVVVNSSDGLDGTINAATTTLAGVMSSTDKLKLDGIAAGAEVNQNAFSNITVGATTIAADGKTDTLTLVAGTNITLTPDAVNDTITIAANAGSGSGFDADTVDGLHASAFQPVDATLTALAGVVTAANKYIYATAADTFTTGTITTFGRSLVDDADAATARTTLGISATNTPSTAVGGISSTNVQAALQELDSEKLTTTELLTAITSIDGAGSGIDADMVDGKHVGTSGNTIPLLDGANTFSNVQTVTTNSTAAGLTITNAGTGVGINTDDIIIGNGTVGAPSLRFANDADTGLYSSAAGRIDFTTNGTDAGYFDSSNNFNINGTLGIKDAVPSSTALINASNSSNRVTPNSTQFGISNTVYTQYGVALTADRNHYGSYNVLSEDHDQTVAFTVNQYANYNWAAYYGGYSLNGEGSVIASHNRTSFNPQNRGAARCEVLVGTDTLTEVMGYITQSVTSTVGSPIVTVTDTSKLAVGDTLWACSNFTNGATILSVDSATQLTMSANATATGTDATCYFSHNAAVPDNVFGTRTIVRNTDYKTTVPITYGSYIQIDQYYTTSTLSTSYGLYIDYIGHGATQTPNAWGVYQIDTDLSKGNYFGSKVWINTTTDDGLSTKLQVNGAISCTTQATTVSDTRVATTAFATPRTGTTGASVIPSGTTAQRPASPVNGYLRYNTDLQCMEAYVNGAWGSVGGGGTNNSAFYENDTTITTSYTITSGKNAMTAGPITINDGVIITIPDGSTWSIV